MGIKSYLKSDPQRLARLFRGCTLLTGRNKIRGKQGNRLEAPGALLHHCRIRLCGTNNEIVIEDLSRLQHCRIYIKGNHNRIHIGREVCLTHTELWIEDDHNELTLGEHTSTDGKPEAPVHLAVIEGTRMVLGKDCMLSSGIEMRTGDSHSIVLAGTEGEEIVRINPSKDVVLGDHIWVGTRAMVLKGSRIPDDSIVGAASLVTGSFEEAGCALAGNPAKVVREGVSWKRERI